ncbi:MAG TPA: hypothetical protein PK405_06890, partial [Hyphomicrobiales bacterium]|nr:hypothetical protein [Hyphomicrobiales bacterium]
IEPLPSVEEQQNPIMEAEAETASAFAVSQEDIDAVLTRGSGEFTGNFLIDDSFLAENGVTDFDKYRVDPARDLAPDFFVPDSSIPPASLKALR